MLKNDSSFDLIIQYRIFLPWINRVALDLLFSIFSPLKPIIHDILLRSCPQCKNPNPHILPSSLHSP